MEITEVRVALKESGNKKLKAYTTVTFDNCFVVRNIKVIEGNSGLFVAMPSKKAKQFCSRCGKKTDVNNKYCGQCGSQLPPPPRETEKDQNQQMYQDIAHPINQQFRDYLQKRVLEEYHSEQEKGKSQSSSAEHPLDDAEDEA